jgi:hypothetical protein
LREHPELCDEDYARELLGYATMAEVTIEA